MIPSMAVRKTVLRLSLSIMSVTLALRNFVENITRSWVYRRRLPPAFNSVPIYVTPAAGLKFLFKSMDKADPPLLRNVRELVQPGNVVWDIGANVGLLTFAAAAKSGVGGAVVAFEPDSWLLQILRRSRSAQPAASAPVTIVPVAVASGVGLRQFNLAARSRASNSLAEYGHSQTGGVMEEYTVPTFTLDWLLENQPKPDLIKCDVEGAEVEVFRGQIKMLNEARPVIMCEVGDEQSDEITAIFMESGYKLFDGEKPLSTASGVSRASWNTIAIPTEKCETLVRPQP